MSWIANKCGCQIWSHSSEQGTSNLLYRCGIHSQHCTFSPLSTHQSKKNIFVLPVLSPNVIKISSRFLLQISLQKQQYILVLPTTLHPIKLAVYTCKVDSYGAMQLGSSLYVVHECVYMPHLKQITTDHTRMGIWRILLLSTQISRHMQAERKLFASQLWALNLSCHASLGYGKNSNFWDRGPYEADPTIQDGKMMNEWQPPCRSCTLYGWLLPTVGDFLSHIIDYVHNCNKSGMS
jgi:hypothetical protein